MHMVTKAIAILEGNENVQLEIYDSHFRYQKKAVIENNLKSNNMKLETI